MKKILFVCLGNICRSPMAEAIFNHKVKEIGLYNALKADSAGTANYHVGDSPDPRTVETLRKKKIFIDHKGQQFKKNHADIFDYLVAMDHSNHSNMIRELQGHRAEKVLLMRNFDAKSKGSDVPDPYYGGLNGFEDVYQILDHSIDNFITFLRKEHQL